MALFALVVAALVVALAMDPGLAELAAQIVGKSYTAQGSEGLQRRRKLVRQLLEKRRLPDRGWDEATLEWWLTELALMDSNNFVGNVGQCSLGTRQQWTAHSDAFTALS